MIITEYGKKDINKPKAYKANCNCGCEFYITEKEFTTVKSPDGAKYIRCPNCKQTLSDISRYIKEIPYEEYERIADIYDC